MFGRSMLFEIMTPESEDYFNADDYEEHNQYFNNSSNELFDIALIDVIDAKIYAIDVEAIRMQVCCEVYKVLCKHRENVQKQNILLSKNAMLVLMVIGNTGLYERCTIFDEFQKLSALYGVATPKFSIEIMQRPLKQLIEMGLVEKVDVVNPLKANYFIYRITDNGKQAYREITDKEPSLPAYGPLGHHMGSINHLICVKELETLCRNSKADGYFYVSSERDECTFNVCGQSYIPDVICKWLPPGGGEKRFDIYEYETGDNTQDFLNAKLDKAFALRHVLKSNKAYINIVTDTKENADRIKSKVNSWVEMKGIAALTTLVNGKAENLVIIRITTLVCVRDAVVSQISLRDKSVWHWINDFRHGISWIPKKTKIKFNAKKHGLKNQPDIA